MDDAALERSTVRRIGLRIVPFLMVCYFVAFVDRVNLGFAGPDLSRDLNLSPTAFGFGAGLFFLAYFLFEVPSNLLMVRVGARRWIARIMVSWGLVAGAMALMTGTWSFYALRVLLGIAEAGFFPGVILYLTYWFPREHRAKVVGWFMLAIPVSTFLGSPVSGVILDGMAGLGGLHGWQWLFIIEALPAVLLGLVVLVWLPDRPADAAWLPQAEKDWLHGRLAAERRAERGSRPQSVWRVMRDKRVLVLGLVYAGSTGTNYGLSFWQPQLIKSFGLSNTMTGIYNALPFLVGSVAMVLWGLRSDRKRERMWHTATALFVSAIGLGACLFVTGLPVTLVALSVALCGCYALKGPFWALCTEWLAAGAAAAGIAQINAIGNLAGFVGPFLLGWIKQMTGSYSLGMLPMIALALVGAVAVVLNGRSARAELAGQTVQEGAE